MTRRLALSAVVLSACAGMILAPVAHGQIQPQSQAEPPLPRPGLNDPSAIRVLLSANPESTISAPMTGRLDTLDAALGQKVAKDAVLIKLDCGEPQARLRMANAELAGARETLKAKVGLRKLDAAGDTEVNLARAATDRAAAATALAQAREEGRQEVIVKNRGFFDFGSKEPIESSIAGEFKGFGKGQHYVLANGQEWEQTESMSTSARKTDPKVKIKPGLGGVWYLQIEGSNSMPKVRRVK